MLLMVVAFVVVVVDAAVIDVVGADMSADAVADVEETVPGTVAITIHANDAVVAPATIGIAAASTGIASAYIDVSTVSIFLLILLK